jgi:DNA-binding FrmR family transcriptional regulator
MQARQQEFPMSHTVKEKAKLLARVRRIKGQVEAIERALENELGCSDVLQLVASVRGAVNGLTVELMEDHIRNHVVNPAREPDPDRARGAEELIEVVRTYLK